MTHRIIPLLVAPLCLALSACSAPEDELDADSFRAAGDPDIFGAPDCDCPTCNAWGFRSPGLTLIVRAEDADPLASLPAPLRLDVTVSRSSFVSIPVADDFIEYQPGCYIQFADFDEGEVHYQGGMVMPLEDMHPKEAASIADIVDKREVGWIRTHEHPEVIVMHRDHNL